MIVFQLLFLVLAGRQVVQFDARIHVAAASYGIFFLAVSLVFGDSFVPALAARLVGGVLAAFWLWLLSRVGGLAFLVVAALCAAIPITEILVLDAISEALGNGG